MPFQLYADQGGGNFHFCPERCPHGGFVPFLLPIKSIPGFRKLRKETFVIESGRN